MKQLSFSPLGIFKRCLPLILFLAPLISHAQIQLGNQWNFGGNDVDLIMGSYHEEGETVLIVNSSSGISGNKTLPSFGSQDAWVLKLNANGSIQKQFVLGGNYSDNPVGIVKNGNHYFVALSSTSGISGNKTMDDYGTGMGIGDFWLVKLNEELQIVDQWSYGSDTGEMCIGIISFDNKILMFGNSSGSAVLDKSENSRGGVDAWVICVDTLGNKIWDKTFGGTNGDHFSKAHITNNGIVFIGESNSDIGFEKSENSFGGSSDIWVVKTDFLGNKIWDKTFGDYDAEKIEYSKIIENKLIVSGFKWGNNVTSGNLNLSNHGEFDGFLLSVELSNPSVFKAKSFGGGLDEGFSNFQGIGNNFLVAGYTKSTDGDLMGSSIVGETDIWISIIDTNFNMLEYATIGSSGSDVAYDLIKRDNGFWVGCYSNSGISGDKTTPNYGLSDVWMFEISHPLSIDDKTPTLFFEMYPNPASDVLYLRELNQQFVRLEVLDIQGRMHQALALDGKTEAQLTVSNLASGTYIAKMQMNNGMWVSKKFVKR